MPLKIWQKSTVFYFTKLVAITLVVLAMCSTFASGSPCSSLTNGIYSIEQYYDKFSEYIITKSIAIVSGPVSGDIYYIYVVKAITFLMLLCIWIILICSKDFKLTTCSLNLVFNAL